MWYLSILCNAVGQNQDTRYLVGIAGVFMVAGAGLDWSRLAEIDGLMPATP